MQLRTASFQFNGVKITVQKPNGFSLDKQWRLHQLLKDYGTDGISVDTAMSFCFYLANTVAVEGALEFPTPLHNATHPELIAFIRGLGMADGNFLQNYNDTIAAAMRASNDEDLLPPEELSQKKETTPE